MTATTKIDWLLEKFRELYPDEALLDDLSEEEALEEALYTARAAFDVASVVERGAGTLFGMILAGDDLQDRAGSVSSSIKDVLLRWRGFLTEHFGADGEHGFAKMEQEFELYFSPLPEPKRDQSVATAVDALVAALQDTTAASQLWRDLGGYADHEHLWCALRRVPPDQPRQLKRLAKRIEAEVPAPIEALYATIDGLHAYMGAAPGGEAEWNDNDEPLIFPLSQAAFFMPDSMGNEPFIAFGTCRRHYVCFLLETGKIALVPWSLDGTKRILADNLVAFLNKLAQTATYL